MANACPAYLINIQKIINVFVPLVKVLLKLVLVAKLVLQIKL